MRDDSPTTPNEWIALVTAALCGPVGQLREDPAKLVTVIDYLERIADQALQANI